MEFHFISCIQFQNLEITKKPYWEIAWPCYLHESCTTCFQDYLMAVMQTHNGMGFTCVGRKCGSVYIHISAWYGSGCCGNITCARVCAWICACSCLRQWAALPWMHAWLLSKCTLWLQRTDQESIGLARAAPSKLRPTSKYRSVHATTTQKWGYRVAVDGAALPSLQTCHLYSCEAGLFSRAHSSPSSTKQEPGERAQHCARRPRVDEVP